MTAPDGAGTSAPAARLAPLDGYRALAAVLVITAHALLNSGAIETVPILDPNRASFFGVAVFFMLSGYLLYEPMVTAHLEGRAPLATAKFLWRRLLRIMPLYWVVLTAYLLIQSQNIDGFWHHVKLYALLQIYDPDISGKGIWPAWTLSVDVSFYLVLPLLAFAGLYLGRRLGGDPAATFRGHAVVVAAFFALGPIWRLAWYVTGHEDLVSMWPNRATPAVWLPAQADLFAVGMGLALLNAARRTSRRPLPSFIAALARLPVPCLMAALAALAVLELVDIPLSTEPLGAGQVATRYAMYVIAGVLLFVPMVLGNRRNRPARFLSSPTLRWISDMSFGVYLWHLIVLYRVRELLGGKGEAGFWEIFVIGMAISLTLAFTCYELVEKPTRRLRDDHRHRVRVARPAAAGAAAGRR